MRRPRGKSHSFGGEYLELVPQERIRWTDRFDDPNLSGEMRVTVSLRKVSVGIDVNIVQEGLPDVIPPEACHLGWHESLTLLAKLVEAEIPDRGRPRVGADDWAVAAWRGHEHGRWRHGHGPRVARVVCR